jgi:hypothetical protein
VAITVVVVVVTANHYWMDGIVALALLAVASRLVRPRSPDPDDTEDADEAEGEPTVLPLRHGRR